ncbi:MAG: sugar phosphate isomerase/epimerase family protein [Lachnospiraceae bacterium]
MEHIKVGNNLPSKTGLTALDSELTRIENDGFDVCEINLATVPLIISGGIQEQVVQYVKKILKKHPLGYTAHVGYGLDLRNLAQYEMHRNVLLASVNVCAKLGIGLLNLHYEVETMFADREAAFLAAHLEAADLGEKVGVKISVENIEIEHALKALAFVKKAGHPNLGMTLDLGHLYISAVHFQYSYLEAVKACAPYLYHLHINDNTGIFEPLRVESHLLYDTLSMNERFTFGRGDIHIPPLWGTAPLADAFGIIKQAGYQGVWLCEYYSQHFIPFNREVQEQVRKAILEA